MIIKILILILLLMGIEGCNISPVKVSQLDGQNFVSCNIDKIKEVRPLRLSEITEYSQIIVLSEDSALQKEDYDIDRVVISEKYIIVITREVRLTLLYNREGKFIKRLNLPENPKLFAIDVQIDDNNDMIYLLVSGFQLLRIDVRDSTILHISKTIDDALDFILLDNDKIFITSPNYQNIWGFIQSIHAPHAEYIHSRSSNNLFNYMSLHGRILKKGKIPVIDFSNVNDTSYYYNSASKTFSPFLNCYSKKYAVDIDIQVENSPEVLDKAGKEILKHNELLSKQLLYAGERYYIFRMYDGERKYFIIDKDLKQAYFFKNIINDFWGEFDIDYPIMFKHYISGKDNYLTFIYNKERLQEEIEKQSQIDETVKNKCGELFSRIPNIKPYSHILIINKLKI